MPKIANKEKLVKLLKANGILRNSMDCYDYEKAKHLIIGNDFIDPELYDELNKFIVDYIGL